MLKEDTLQSHLALEKLRGGQKYAYKSAMVLKKLLKLVNNKTWPVQMKKAIFLALGGIAGRRKSRPKNVFKLAMKNLSTCPRVTFLILQDQLNIKKNIVNEANVSLLILLHLIRPTLSSSVSYHLSF